jgi:SAM-dependent methyltransferase
LVPAPTSNLRIASEKPQQWGFFYGFEENRVMTQTLNVDPAELAKFSDLAHRWWDPESEFRPLHQINPLRLEWINGLAPLAGQRVLDVGCGGGHPGRRHGSQGRRCPGDRSVVEVAEGGPAARP